MSQSTRKILFELHGIPKFTEALPLAMQHVVAMIIGCITPAIVISAVAKVSPEDTMLLIQASLVTAAIATFIQLYPLAGRVGAGIPVVMGVSFAYVPVLIAIGASMGLPAILGAQIVGGFAAIIVGIFIRRLRPLFPPLVSGTVVFTIGLSLYPVAIRYMAGGAGAAGGRGKVLAPRSTGGWRSLRSPRSAFFLSLPKDLPNLPPSCSAWRRDIFSRPVSEWSPLSGLLTASGSSFRR